MAKQMFLYIDPATGGMLFTILFSLIGTVLYFLKSLRIKIKYRLGKKEAMEKNRDKLPIVIFVDDKRYWNVFEPICDEMERRKQKLHYLTMSEDDPVLEKQYEYISAECIGTGNKAFSRLNYLSAVVMVSTTPSLDVFQWKRSKNVQYYIHIFHAPNDVVLYRMFGIDYYDALLLSGEYQVEQIRTLERLRGLPQKELELVGIPYLDVLKARLERTEPIGEHERTVLVAPTWGNNGILKKYGERLLDVLVQTGYRIVVRPHPQSFTTEKEMIDRLMKKYEDYSNLEWNRDNDNFDILHQSDIMISDYSGVIFDFALVFRKPVIFTQLNLDLSPYDGAWLDEELWTYSALPRLGRELRDEDIDGIGKLIDTCLEDPEFQREADGVREETWVHVGEGAVRATDYILRKYQEVLSDVDPAETEDE